MKEQMSNKKLKKSRMATTNVATKKKYKQLNKKPVKQHGKVSGIVKKVILVLVLMVLAVVFICTSGAFCVTDILVEGNSYISNEQIESFSRIEKGTNIFAISKKSVIQNLKENSYIEEVEVKRIFPNQIKLIVKEREVAYVLQLANSYVYIDKQGYVLEISNDRPNVPIIVGFVTDLSNIKGKDRLGEEDLKKLNVVIKIMETASANGIVNLITKIDVSNEMDYVIVLESEGKTAHLGEGVDLNTRILYVKAILQNQQGKSGEIFANVDLNAEYVYFAEK